MSATLCAELCLECMACYRMLLIEQRLMNADAQHLEGQAVKAMRKTGLLCAALCSLCGLLWNAG